MNVLVSEQVTAQTAITEKDAIRILYRYALERQEALKAYRTAVGYAEKQLAIDEIFSLLFEAKQQASPKRACKIILRTALNFHFIAPRSTRKQFANWVSKIEDVMAACRSFLGVQSQKAA